MISPYGAPSAAFYGAMLPPGANPYAGFGMNPALIPQETASGKGTATAHNVVPPALENKGGSGGGTTSQKTSNAGGLTSDPAVRGSSADGSGGVGPSGDADPLAKAQWADDKEIKRLRRKQSNRESARRSRLRKQAECEELSGRVEVLTTENAALQAELQKLKDRCMSLKETNASLQLRLRDLKMKQEPLEETPGAPQKLEPSLGEKTV